MTETPKGAKKPQDRKPKAPAADALMTAEVAGMTLTVDPAAMDDFELLDELARLDDGEAVRMPRVLRKLLGDKQMVVAMECLRDDDTGRVSLEVGAQFVRDLMAALRPNS